MMPPVAAATFGANVRDILDARGMKYKDFALALGTTPDRVSKIFDSVNPELDTLFWVAKALKITIESLVVNIDPDYDAWRVRQGRLAEVQARLPDLTDDQLLLILRVMDQLHPSPGPTRTTDPDAQG